MTTLNDRFAALKANLEPNATFAGLIQQRHNAVRNLIENRNPKVVETKLIGSVSRKTRIQPRPEDNFDIDILVVMGSFHSWLPPGTPGAITPQVALNDLHQTIMQSDRYGAMGSQQAPPTIVMAYADKTAVEFVPAYIDRIGASPNGTPHTPVGRAYWVPKNNSWELADYDYEADYISGRNDTAGGWLIPTIKMIKAIRRIYFPSMKSFHLDILATAIVPPLVEVKNLYEQTISYPELVADFFGYAPEWLSLATRIPGSHSPAVAVVQADLNALTETFRMIKKYIDTLNVTAQESKKVEGWKQLFGDPFPST
jgi:hypothetical protein